MSINPPDRAIKSWRNNADRVSFNSFWQTLFQAQLIFSSFSLAAERECGIKVYRFPKTLEPFLKFSFSLFDSPSWIWQIWTIFTSDLNYVMRKNPENKFKKKIQLFTCRMYFRAYRVCINIGVLIFWIDQWKIDLSLENY